MDKFAPRLQLKDKITFSLGALLSDAMTWGSALELIWGSFPPTPEYLMCCVMHVLLSYVERASFTGLAGPQETCKNGTG